MREDGRPHPPEVDRTVKKVFFVTLIVGALGAGVYWWSGSGRTQALTESGLTFANLQRGTMRDVVSATGLVEPREIVVVASAMPGTVVCLRARVNELVGAGAELAQLDSRKILLKREEAQNGIALAEAAIAQARATLTQARAQHEAALVGLQYQEDLSTKGGFRSEREQAAAQLRAAGAGVEAAESGLGAAQAKLQAARTGLKEAELAHQLTALKVPQSGGSAARREFLVLERKVHEGEMVGPQSGPLFVLAGGLDHVELHAQVAEGDINKVRAGLTAFFAVTAFGDNEVEFTGAVKEVRPLANNVKGGVYYDTIIQVANRRDPVTAQWLLRPGMTASVDVVRREHKDVWKVPSAALNFQLDEGYQSESVRARVAEWKRRPDAADWQILWTWDADARAAQPLFARLGGLKNGESGLKDSEGNEVLEWAAGQEPALRPLPRLIVGAPPAHAPGFFDQPTNIKIS
jgi:HlyD family secretion protein